MFVCSSGFPGRWLLIDAAVKRKPQRTVGRDREFIVVSIMC